MIKDRDLAVRLLSQTFWKWLQLVSLVKVILFFHLRFFYNVQNAAIQMQKILKLELPGNYYLVFLHETFLFASKSRLSTSYEFSKEVIYDTENRCYDSRMPWLDPILLSRTTARIIIIVYIFNTNMSITFLQSKIIILVHWKRFISIKIILASNKTPYLNRSSNVNNWKNASQTQFHGIPINSRTTGGHATDNF